MLVCVDHIGRVEHDARNTRNAVARRAERYNFVLSKYIRVCTYFKTDQMLHAHILPPGLVKPPSGIIRQSFYALNGCMGPQTFDQNGSRPGYQRLSIESSIIPSETLAYHGSATCLDGVDLCLREQCASESCGQLATIKVFAL